MDSDQGASDSPRGHRILQVCRALALSLLAAEYLTTLYAMFSYDAWWLGSGPDSPLELVVVGGALAVLLGTAVALFADWRNHKTLAILNTAPMLAMAAIIIFHLALFSLTTGVMVFIAEGRIMLFFGVAVPLLCLLLIAFDRRDRHRLTFAAPETLKRPVLIGLAGALAVTITWWVATAPSGSIPDLKGTIVVAGDRLTTYTPRTGAVATTAWDEHAPSDRAEFTDFFCIFDRKTALLGYRGTGFRYEPWVPFYTCLPFDTVYRSGPVIADADSCISMDYFEKNKTYLFTGRYRGKPEVVLFDSAFNHLQKITTKLNIIGVDGSLTGHALFLDSLRILVVYPERCDVVNLQDSSRVQLARGDFRAISPDRNWILVANSKYKPSQLFVVNTRDRQRNDLGDLGFITQEICFSPDSRMIAYSLFTPGLDDPGSRFYICELASMKVWKTPLHNQSGVVFWLPLARAKS